MDNQQELMLGLFPEYAEEIRQRNLQPFRHRLILPCNHKVDCLIISIHELLHLVYEEKSEDKRSYVYRGELTI